jgi:SPP1 family holin
MVIDQGTQLRITLFILTWLNTWLASKGLPHLPVPFINDETAAIVLSIVITGWTTFRNNYLTRKGKAQRAALKRNNLL